MFSGFMTNAWLAGTMVAVVAGAVGFFVVLRGSSFAAHAIPNGSFAGATGANLVGLSPLVGLGVFSVAAALGIGLVGRRSRPDVVTALALVLMLAIGAAFLSQSSQYEAAIYSLLFGEILGVSTSQLLPVALVAVACLVVLAVTSRSLLLSSLVPDVAQVRGISPLWMEIASLLVIAGATTITVPVVGALLMFTLMIGPAATARVLCSRPLTAVVVAVALALLTIWLSILLSYETNWPTGFFVGCFGATWYASARIFLAASNR